LTATIYSLTREVREAALDVKAVQRRIQEAGERAYQWYPARASARARMIALSLDRDADHAKSAIEPEASPGAVSLKLSASAEDSAT
jgi:hypothetical protein